MKEPTSEQCSENAILEEDEHFKIVAIWYPQMGGYSGKAAVQITKNNPDDCFTAWVWHDGEFPFTEDDERQPSQIHHCDADQFISFGETIKSLQA